eukprot:scaffold3421_cov181-Amphora_coffeaeformis.AAC.15
MLLFIESVAFRDAVYSGHYRSRHVLCHRPLSCVSERFRRKKRPYSVTVEHKKNLSKTSSTEGVARNREQTSRVQDWSHLSLIAFYIVVISLEGKAEDAGDHLFYWSLSSQCGVVHPVDNAEKGSHDDKTARV